MRHLLISLPLSLALAIPAMADVTLEDQRLFLAPPGSAPALGFNLELGDANGDGSIDMAVGDAQVNLTGAGWVLLGPDFSTSIPLVVPGLSGQAAFGFGVWRFTDLNADGFDDVLCSAPWADAGGMSRVGRVFVFYGPTFQTMTEVPVPGGGATDLTFGFGGAVHDYTADGSVDLILGSPGAVLSSVTLAGRIDVFSGATGFVGPPVATFMPPNPSTQRLWGYGLEVADHDGDGKPDLGTTEYPNGTSGFRWLKGFDPNDTVFIQPPGLVSGLGYGTRILVVDVDEDGAPDVVSGAPAGSGKVVRMSGPTFTTQFLLPPGLDAGAHFGQGVDIGDVDRDGNLDIVAGGPKDDLGLMNDAGRVSIFFGPSFLARQDLWGEFAKSELGYGTKLVDLDGDGFSELLVGAGKEWGGGALHLYRHRTLRVVGPDTVSLTSGGTATLRIEDGRLSKQRPYLILSSTSGSSPGFSFPYGSGAVDVPLNWDAFTTLALPLANTPLFAGFSGTLSTPGEATANLTVPPGAGAPSLAGTTLTFCALIADAAGAPARATHADEVTLTP